MIEAADLTLVGKVNKTHGIGGELSVSFLEDEYAEAVEMGECLIMDIDGIFTPFFTSSTRPRGNGPLLVRLDGFTTQQAAAYFVGRSMYMLTSRLPEIEEPDEDDEGFYAGQLIGFTAIDIESNKTIGKIVDIDEQTQNVLFIIESPDGDTVYIPVADEFIAEILVRDKKIMFDLPEGLL